MDSPAHKGASEGQVGHVVDFLVGSGNDIDKILHSVILHLEGQRVFI